MREWCDHVQTALESLYLRGKISFTEYVRLAEIALGLHLEVRHA